MKVLCKYYANTTRLIAGVSSFSGEQGFRFFCLEGSITKNKAQFKAHSDVLTVLVSCISAKTKKNLMVILTNSPRFSAMDGKPIELNYDDFTGIGYTLCELLREKYSTTGNKFQIDFADKGSTITITPDMDAQHNPYLVCCMRGPSGEVLMTGEASIQNALRNNPDIKGFSYTTESAEVEKTVTVRKSRGEIFREISHYLNRTVVLVSCSEDNRLIEQYISATAVLEIYTNQQGVRFYKKISPIVLKSTKPFCIYLTSASIDDIAREQGRNLKKSQS